MKFVRKKKPDRKIVIFSQFLKWLDIVQEALLRKLELESLRYDGLVPSAERKQLEDQFTHSDNKRPFLITANSGGVGLNILTASIVIQTEVWWNGDQEL